VGGQSNTASGLYSIAGGFTNTASGAKSIAFGDGSVASGIGAIALGVSSSTATFSTALGGRFNRAGSDFCVVLGGNQSQAYLRNQLVANSNSGTTDWSDNQLSQLSAYRYPTLTTAATATLSLDGTGVTNLIIPNGQNRSWNVQVRWVAVVTAITGTATGVTVGDTKVSTDLLAVARRTAATTVSAHTSAGTQSIETIAGSLTAVNIVYSAGASQEMAITFTGPTFAGGGSVTMRVVAAISLTEVAY
jgi:hypothetical protein